MIHSDVIKLYLDSIHEEVKQIADIAYDPLFFIVKSSHYYSSGGDIQNNPFSDVLPKKLYDGNFRSNLLRSYFKDNISQKLRKKQNFAAKSISRTIECIAFISAFFAFGSRTGIIHFLAKLFSAVNLYAVINRDCKTAYRHVQSDNGNNKTDNSDSKVNNSDAKQDNKDLQTDNRDSNTVNRSTKINTIANIVSESCFIDKTKLVQYRWITTDFILVLLHSLSEFYNKNESIEDFFTMHMYKKKKKSNFIEVQNLFIHELKSIFIKKAYETNIKVSEHSLRFFFTSSKKSGMKRLQLFLKWMIRDDFPDTGLWKSFDKNMLYYPLDTHILRVTNSFVGFLLRNNTAELHAVVYKINSGSIEKLPMYLDSLKIENSGKILKHEKLSKTNGKAIFDNEVYKNHEEVIGENDKNKKVLNKIDVKEIKMKEQNSHDFEIHCNSNDKNSICRSLAKDFNKVLIVRENMQKYFKKYSGFFANKTKNIFSNKAADMIAVTDFYKCFMPNDPLLFDFPLALINSKVKKTKEK